MQSLAMHLQKRNLTQAEVADAAKIPRSHLSRIVSGKIASPRIDTLRRIADVLGITLSQLLKGES